MIDVQLVLGHHSKEELNNSNVQQELGLGQLMGMYLSHRAHGHECPPPSRGNWEETFIYLRTNLN